MQDEEKSLDDNDSAPILQKKWIKDQMKKRQREFCEPTVFSVFCASWNVNDKILADDEDSLCDWLLPHDQFLADVFAVGFQETVELSTMNVVFDGSKSADRAAYWQRKIKETFLSRGLQYSLIEERHLVGNLICIFAKSDLVPFIRGIRGATTPVGIMGVMGNKGAVVIRFRIYNTTVCLVCSHLSANRDNVLGRNNDVRSINEKTALYPSLSNAGQLLDGSELVLKDNNYKDLSTQWANETALPLLIDDHDVILWFGDLNYRIQESIPASEVMEIVKRGGSSSLISKDQLNLEMGNKNVFHDYEEGIIDFPPTYKYQPGTDVYDCRSEKKLRAPAWCDRVLWKENSTINSVRQLNYRRAELNISDHKPISALFNIDSGITDPIRERSLYQELLSKVDKWENASAPKLIVEDRVIDFGIVQVQEWKSNCMIVKNIGTVFSSWKFVPKFEENIISLPWLNFYPLQGILAPGEEAQVTVSLCVTSSHIEALLLSSKTNNNLIPLEDIAIISVTGGSDFFCIFSGMLNVPHADRKSSSIIFDTEDDEKSSNDPSMNPMITESDNEDSLPVKKLHISPSSTAAIHEDNSNNMNKNLINSLPVLNQVPLDQVSSHLHENKMPPIPPAKPPKSEKAEIRNKLTG